MANQKRIAAIHDISGIGKCSLTVAIPIISAVGVETAVIPTAVLSTHTGGFKNFTYRDLTSDMLPIAEQWKSNRFHFDAIYSGFLGSTEQVEIVGKIFDILKSDDTIIMVDPAMADNGRLYKTFAPDFPKKMAELAKSADILTPNITEACLMTDMPYSPGPYTKPFIDELIRKVADLGCGRVVLTGVYFDEKSLGAATYNSDTDIVNYIFSEKQKGFYPGTGDVFASSLLGAIMNGFTLENAVKVAVDYVRLCIIETNKMDDPINYGVNFESVLPNYIQTVKGIK